MNYSDVSTGEEFEQYVMGLFRLVGLNVSDTPPTNDYGADLIIESNYRYAVQCKFYSRAVGIKAIQEVIGALTYYNCDYGIVVTNDSFTQQACNLADSNNVLLVDGKKLNEFSERPEDIEKCLSEFTETSSHAKHSTNQPDEYWTVNDLVIRYGVSKDKIYKDCLGNGLPHYKVGREYRCIPEKVKAWELRQRYIPTGRNGRMMLPEFIMYRNRMLSKLEYAKKIGDKKKIKEIKDIMREKGIDIPYKTSSIAVFVFYFIVILVLLGFCFQQFMLM